MMQLGIVGAGFMAETHADRYDAIPGAEVSAVASPNTAEAFVADKGINATAYADAEEMYEDAEVDAVDICTPTHTHESLVIGAAERGLDIICEKPLARYISEAERITDAVDDAGITAMVGHVIRFFPEYAQMREQALSGLIGEPGVARARRLSPFPDWGRDNWFGSDEASGGVFLDMMVHDFDYLRWLFGDVKRVFGRLRTMDDRQHGHAVLRFEDGSIGYVEGSTAQPTERGFRTDLEIAGDGGLLEYENTDPEPIEIVSEAESAGAIGNLPERQLEKDAFLLQLEAFVDSVENGTEPPVSLADATEAMRISLAAKRSAAEGRAVDPAEVTA